MINDLKPKIFNTKSDAELFRFISANFQTKKSSEKMTFLSNKGK